MIKKLTKRQIKISIILAMQMFGNGLVIALQAPFYTSVADSKGASPSECGFVFGVYFLTQFIMSPIYGQFITQVGVKRMINVGAIVAGVSCIAFGTLIYVDGKNMFIGLSFIIRILEALGASAFRTAFFSIVAQEFPDNVGAALSGLQSPYPLGLIVGPTLGGILYELGGYATPFVVLGSVLLLVGVSAHYVLPNYECTKKKKASSNIFTLLYIPEVSLAMLTIFVETYTLGFYNVNLETHLRQFSLSPAYVGLMFVNMGIAQFPSAIITGRLLDRDVSPRTIILVSCLLDIVSFTIVGPAPFLPFKTSIYLIVVALLLHGIGYGTKHISSIAGGQKDVINAGLPSCLQTSGQVAGLWSAFHAAGAFSGPIISGILMDNLGFRTATLSIVGLQGFLLILCIIFKIFRKWVPIQNQCTYNKVPTAESEHFLQELEKR